MTDVQRQAMKTEYDKNGKFKEFVDKSCRLYETTPEDAFEKVIVWEYFLSVKDYKGCNYDRAIHGDENKGV